VNQSQTQGPRWVALGAYVFALTLVLGPVIDLITTVLPARPGDVSWRYGFLGLGGGYLQTPLLGVGIAMAVAIWQEDVVLLRALGITATVGAVALLPIMGTWALDVMQMREMREPEVRGGVLMGGVIQGAKYLGACVALGLAGVGVSKKAKAMRSHVHAEDRSGSPGSLRRD
jgi:hypothetical protein